MIRTFHGAGTEDVYNGRSTRNARQACPEAIWRVARRKLDMLNAAESLSSLRFPPGNGLEALKGNRSGQHSIRINDQYRICFIWKDTGVERVEIVDYH